MFSRINNFKKQLDNYLIDREMKKVGALNPTRFKPSDAMIISGEPRGGTTWLAELLLQIDGSSLIWEPLHQAELRRENHSMKTWSEKVGKMPFVPFNAKDEELYSFMTAILTGSNLNRHQLGHNTSINWKSNKQWIVKFCRANLLLPWIVKNFELKFAPIYLLRHPLAVVSSQMRHKAFDQFPTSFLIPDVQHKEYFKHYASVLKKVKTKEAYHAAFWSLNNALPLSQINNGFITISYENLVEKPKSELAKIEHSWNLDLYDLIKDKLKEPSHTTKQGSNILQGDNQLYTYKKHLSLRQQEEIMSIVKDFGIDVYSLDSPFPNY